MSLYRTRCNLIRRGWIEVHTQQTGRKPLSSVGTPRIMRQEIFRSVSFYSPINWVELPLWNWVFPSIWDEMRWDENLTDISHYCPPALVCPSVPLSTFHRPPSKFLGGLITDDPRNLLRLALKLHSKLGSQKRIFMVALYYSTWFN